MQKRAPETSGLQGDWTTKSRKYMKIAKGLWRSFVSSAIQASPVTPFSAFSVSVILLPDEHILGRCLVFY
jgi:hypothetical protein